jgi:hypothetical protein
LHQLQIPSNMMIRLCPARSCMRRLYLVKREAEDGKTGPTSLFDCEIRFDWLTVLSVVEGRDTLHEERAFEQFRHEHS